jgi:hypothetical protein
LFVGHPAYGPDDLRGDLERFVFLPGGSDGEPPFGPQSPSPPRPQSSGETEPGADGLR